MPIYVLRANTINQMEQFLAELFNISNNVGDGEQEEGVMSATRAAIDAVLNGENWVELPPASAYVRRQQHELARQARLISHSYGKEPYRRVRIFREQAR
jgi:predicted RNA-binding protein Jag